MGESGLAHRGGEDGEAADLTALCVVVAVGVKFGVLCVVDVLDVEVDLQHPGVEDEALVDPDIELVPSGSGEQFGVMRPG